jgi:heavy-metal-associated domain-containing protein
MAVDAYVHHHIPGRLRLRIPSAKGEKEALREISGALARAPGISQIDYNPITGSILIRYSPEHYHNLRSLESGLSGMAVPITLNHSHSIYDEPRRRHKDGRSAAARKVDAFFKQVDHEIRSATDNEVDLKFILPFGVALLGLMALRYSSTTPLWLTLLIFAFNSFLGLHAPTPGELGITGNLELEG